MGLKKKEKSKTRQTKNIDRIEYVTERVPRYDKLSLLSDDVLGLSFGNIMEAEI